MRNNDCVNQEDIKCKLHSNGYIEHIVQPEEQFFDILNTYDSSSMQTIIANSNINPFILEEGENIVVPSLFDVVQVDAPYCYYVMQKNIKALKKRYPFLKVFSIGKSVEGRELYCIQFGKGPKEVFYNAVHHAVEWITAPLLMKWIEQVSKAYGMRGSIRGYSMKQLWKTTSLFIVPMVNPDGVELEIKGVSKDNPRYDMLIKWNHNSTDFTKWKANIRGVDLNRNYNAGWHRFKSMEKRKGIVGPSSKLYSGDYPESEPESKAIADFTRKHNFSLVISYHTQGQVIYWTYKGLEPECARKIAQKFSNVSKYELSQPDKYAVYAGYKDWFIKEYRKPGYTVEAGRGVNPLEISQFERMYKNNEELLILGSII